MMSYSILKRQYKVKNIALCYRKLFNIIITFILSIQKNTENMEVQPVNKSLPHLSNQISELSQVQIEMVAKNQFRRHKISSIRQEIEGKLKENQRKKENILLYFLNLGLLVAMSCMNADSILNTTALRGQKTIGMMVIAGLIFIVGLFSGFMLAPWRQVLKLYILIDNTVPVLMAALIGFNAMVNFFKTGEWMHTAAAVFFPIWVVSLGVNQRVIIKYGNWTRWQVVLYKIVLASNAIVFFYIGFEYMNGAYKFSKGYLASMEMRYRDLILLYVFGVTQLYYEYFRRVCYFDQTEELRYQYAFKSHEEQENKKILDQELKRIEFQQLKQQFLSNLAQKVKQKNQAYQKESSQSSKSEI